MTIFRRAPTGVVASGAFALGLFYAAGVTYAAPVANEVMLVNAKTGKCLTIAGGVSTANNVEAVQFDCDSDPSRRWTLKRDRRQRLPDQERADREVPDDRRGREHRQQRDGSSVQLRQRSVAHLEDHRRDRQRRPPDQERADQQVPDDCRRREHRKQRDGSSVRLRQRSVAPLDYQAEAVARATVTARVSRHAADMPPNWGIGRHGNSRLRSEQFRSAHRTRRPLLRQADVG